MEAREALLLALSIGRVSYDRDSWFASGSDSHDRVVGYDEAEAALAAADPDTLIAAVRAEERCEAKQTVEWALRRVAAGDLSLTDLLNALAIVDTLAALEQKP